MLSERFDYACQHMMELDQCARKTRIIEDTYEIVELIPAFPFSGLRGLALIWPAGTVIGIGEGGREEGNINHLTNYEG